MSCDVFTLFHSLFLFSHSLLFLSLLSLSLFRYLFEMRYSFPGNRCSFRCSITYRMRDASPNVLSAFTYFSLFLFRFRCLQRSLPFKLGQAVLHAFLLLVFLPLLLLPPRYVRCPIMCEESVANVRRVSPHPNRSRVCSRGLVAHRGNGSACFVKKAHKKKVAIRTASSPPFSPDRSLFPPRRSAGRSASPPLHLSTSPPLHLSTSPPRIPSTRPSPAGWARPRRSAVDCANTARGRGCATE